MPLALWLALGGAAAYLVFRSAHSAVSSAASQAAANALVVHGPAGKAYTIPVDGNLPPDVASQLQTFFGQTGQTDGTVAAMSAVLAEQGFPVTAGSVENVWVMMVQDMALASNAGGASGAGIPLSTGLPHAGTSTSPSTTSPIASAAYSKVPTAAFTPTKL